MGEIVVSARPGEELMAIGLGSCIGLALVDRPAGVAGLAHVVLPDSAGGPAAPPGKYADTAVPELIRRLEAIGAVRRRLDAVLVGGARMFAIGASLDIGARNVDAVRAALHRAGLRVHAEDTGGDRGRTARVKLGGEITSQLAGGARTTMLSLSGARRSTAAAMATTAQEATR